MDSDSAGCTICRKDGPRHEIVSGRSDPVARAGLCCGCFYGVFGAVCLHRAPASRGGDLTAVRVEGGVSVRTGGQEPLRRRPSGSCPPACGSCPPACMANASAAAVFLAFAVVRDVLDEHTTADCSDRLMGHVRREMYRDAPWLGQVSAAGGAGE